METLVTPRTGSLYNVVMALAKQTLFMSTDSAIKVRDSTVENL